MLRFPFLNIGHVPATGGQMAFTVERRAVAPPYEASTTVAKPKLLRPIQPGNTSFIVTIVVPQLVSSPVP
jgi:hypothetical protein